LTGLLDTLAGCKSLHGAFHHYLDQPWKVGLLDERLAERFVLNSFSLDFQLPPFSFGRRFVSDWVFYTFLGKAHRE
jgi:hypothetical protein